MKFIIINSFRTMVYVAYFAIIGYGVWTGFYNDGAISAKLPGVTAGSSAAEGLDVFLGLFGGWVVASIVCGMIVTILDIRDDINDRLPDERKAK